MHLVRSIRARKLASLALLFAFGLALYGSAQAGSVTYEVDSASGRVTKAKYADGSYVTYTYDVNGNRTSAVVTLSADTTPPTTPGGLTATAISGTQINLTWTASTDNRALSTYKVERCTGSGCSSWSQVATPAPAATSYSDTGLTLGTTYRYRMRAMDTSNLHSSYTSAVTRATLDTQAPGSPGVPTFSSIAGTTATATWTAASDNVGVTGYESRLNSGSWTTSTSPRSLTGLTNGTTYSFSVRARDAAGNWGTPSSANFTTLDTAAPSAPGVPVISAITGSTATATWSNATDNVGVTGYQYQLNGGAWTTATSPRSLTGLTGGTSYTFAVRARDAAGNWGNSSSTTFSTSDTTAPSAPGVPTFGSIAQTSATVSWTAATDNVGVTAYQYAVNGGAWTAGTSPVSLTGLAAATLYTVQVRARDAAGNWGTASSASFTTLTGSDTTAPSAPGVPSFSSITGTSATATWSAATDNVGVTGYQYSLNGGAWTTGSSPLSLTGLTNATSYTLQVRARDAAGNFGNPSSGSFSTPDTAAPGVPGTPSFSSVTGSSATATWTAASDNLAVTGYQYSLNGGAWTAGSSPLSLTSLTNGTTYTLQVRARDAAGNWGNPSSNSFTTLDTAAPTTPGAPSFSSITGSSATATWTGSTDNVAVTAYEYSFNGGAWTSNGMSTSLSLTGLSNATSYSLQVRARDAANNVSGVSSNSFTTTDTAAPSAPGTPTFSSVTGSSAVASWGAASDNVGVTGYEYSFNGGGWTAGSSPLSLTGLANSTTYSLSVRARDAAGNVGSASGNSFTTLDTTVPSAPGTPTFSSIGPTSAVVSFSAASDNVGVAGYEYLLNGAGWSVASSGMTLSGLSTGASYTVHVRAYDAAGNRGDPSVNSFSTIDNIAPSAPGAVSFSSISSTSAVASWGAATDNLGVARYEYSVNGGGWVNVGNTTSASVSGLSAGTSNSVAVRAVDGAGNAGGATSGSVTTLALITIANRNVNTVVNTGFAGGSAIYQLTSAGDIMVTQPTSSTAIDGGDWLAPKTDMGNFQVMSTQVSSTACSSATHGTWMALSSNVTWAVGRGGPSGTTACTFDIQIRHSSNPSVILGTARIGISITN